MTIKEYKEEFEKLFEKMEEEHGPANCVMIQRDVLDTELSIDIHF